ncbi:hypothetical protein PpBr36_07507 [Pyricularia pennisetigena]|uniref:hypothetical protein n=1 Tax=Pyricularia pennisetigena TaxID=1578925 RepID=UPI0011524C96|nr:hypothetical protein PpBr36_07507 [Pyricularia pennisetigena]TLS24953.1 hypothetical protein PpBr36_07507 [Pyricularia pennisetigena]
MGFPTKPRRHWLHWLYLLLQLLQLLPLVTSEPIDHASTTPATSRSSTATVCRWNPAGPLLPRTSASCPPAVDDTTTTTAATGRTSTPWTQTPFCIANGGYDKEAVTSRRYCTFTSATFRSGRGLSFVGTPEAAAGLADALLSEPWHSRFPSHVDVLADTNRSSTYAVVPVPGKGLGVVATRRIRAGEILVADHPLLLADVEAAAAARGGLLLRLAVESLPLPGRFFDLARSYGAGDAVEDVLNTNTFAVGVGDGDYMGLYPEIARINHACSPNSFSRFHPSDLTMDVGAMRDIMPGEEITISYIPLGLPSTHRAAKIRDWGFACTCRLCSTPTANRLSDQRRERLGGLRGRLVHGRAGMAVAEVHAAAEEMMEIAEAEGVLPQLGGYCEAVAQVLLAKGDGHGALRYLRLSLDAWLLYGGEDHAHVPNVRSNLRDLEAKVLGGGGLKA